MKKVMIAILLGYSQFSLATNVQPKEQEVVALKAFVDSPAVSAALAERCVSPISIVRTESMSVHEGDIGNATVLVVRTWACDGLVSVFAVVQTQGSELGEDGFVGYKVQSLKVFDLP